MCRVDFVGSNVLPVRTICIPVAEVVEGGSKSEFYADLRSSLDTARRTANKAVTLCLAADAELMSGGKCPKLYTYPMVSREFPGVASIASSVCRAVEAKYRQERWHVANGRKSVCHYRSFPWVLLSNKSTKTITIEDCGEFLKARIKLLGGWWTVRFAAGSSHRDQIRGLRNALRIGDSKVWIDRKHRAIIGVSAETPAAKETRRADTLHVSTARESLIVCTKERSDTPFIITGEQAKMWISERDRKYQRLRQDRKSGVSRQALSAALRRNGDRWKRRMDSFIHEVSAKVVAHAKRRKCGVVKFDGTVKSFADLPWFDLSSKLKYKCEDAGIEFLECTQSVAEPDISKPHVYFKFSPSTGRVKIGKTGRTDGGRHRSETDAPEHLVILAIDNQPKSKLTAREKHHHAYFSDHRVKGEWFAAEPVIHWLREAEWLGNAGNLSQIAQVLPVHSFASEPASTRPECERASGEDPDECSQMRLKGEDMTVLNSPALAVTE